MGWTPLLVADFTLPAKAHDAWLATPLAREADDFEGLFFHDSDDLAGAETVADVLDMMREGSEGMSMAREGDALAIRCALSAGDVLNDLGAAIARAMRAVESVGGSGSVTIVDAGTAAGTRMKVSARGLAFADAKLAPKEMREAFDAIRRATDEEPAHPSTKRAAKTKRAAPKKRPATAKKPRAKKKAPPRRR